MKFKKGIPEHTFVTIVGVAAFIHSTWTVATFSGGIAPAVNVSDLGTGIVSVLAWLWWVIPGALAAFALEVGQVVTARQIQHNIGRKIRVLNLSINVKTITFLILSAATYLLQLTYLLHHFPSIPLAAGLSEASQQRGIVVKEFVTWGMPLLLPLAMLMFTAGDESEVSRSEALLPRTVSCPDCDWSRTYSDDLSAQNALNGHRAKHSLLPLSSNGKH